PAGTPGALPLPAETGTGQVPVQGTPAAPVTPGVPQQWPGTGDTTGTGTPAPAVPAAGTPAPGTPLPA
ncbi:hypothetical protein GT346_31375, partial [Streptomyces sp. SID161]|nr:hypothetical protein [Streptomyces sp. SID161]